MKHWSVVVLILAASVCTLHAQWVNIAPNRVQMNVSFTYGGAACFKDGELWVGSQNLYHSSDSGRSWNLSATFSSTEQICEIVFFDKLVGILTTVNGIYRTLDGGQNWARISSQQTWSIAFGKSSSIIHVLDYGGGVNTSLDGGVTWTYSLPDASSQWGLTMKYYNGKLYVFVGTPGSSGFSTGWIMVSTDEGSTWTRHNGTPEGDCFSLFIDPCTPGLMYLSNEGVAIPDNGESEIFRSTDEGETWQTVFSRPISFVSGSISGTGSALYATTTADKVIRSTDKGSTWTETAGPTTRFDSRGIACISDNIAVILAGDGSIWRTENAGGDSLIALPSSGSLLFSEAELFRRDTVRCNDTVYHTIMVSRTGCVLPDVKSLRIGGPDSVHYLIESNDYDSLVISFTSVEGRSHNGYLIIESTTGKLDTIALFGTGEIPKGLIQYSTHELFRFDTVRCSDSVRRKIGLKRTGCLIPSIANMHLGGPDSAYYHFGVTGDSIEVSFGTTGMYEHEGYLFIEGTNGQFDTIRLLGTSAPPFPLAIETENVETLDTIGGTVRVPIVLRGIPRAETVELVIHYDQELEYLGSFSETGARLDMQNEGWTGRAKLSISYLPGMTIAGYAYFNVFADSVHDRLVRFDSLEVTTSTCRYTVSPAVSIVTPPSGCFIEILSRFVHLGEKPDIRITPNPGGNVITVSSDGPLVVATINIVDLFGTTLLTKTGKLGASNPQVINLGRLASGTYLVLVETPFGRRALRYIHQ